MKLLRNIAGLALIAVLLAAPALAGDTYQIDPAHTNVMFTVRHMVVAKVTGRFNKFNGTVYFDEKDPTKSWAKGTIEVKSIDTDNEKRDAHLRSSDFFAAKKYPQITFASKKVVKKGDGWVAIGDLTIRGVTREVEIPFQILGIVKDPMGNKHLGLEAHLTINRHDFGVSWNRKLDAGGVVVGDKVNITINAEAVAKAKK